DTPPAGPVTAVDGSTGQVNRRSMVSRLGHRIDLVDASGSDGLRLTTAGDQLTMIMDQAQTSITLQADGTIKIVGSKGVTIDSGSADLELKGNKISLNGSSGVAVDGGQGSVDVSATGSLTLVGTAVSIEGRSNAELKAGAMCSVRGSLVKIN
ncbi:MAG: type IV secretion protein Rhs, partial [Microlunatus sp.]|nr:type IV secretion protein Rhs [Microlunatus sp.]